MTSSDFSNPKLGKNQKKSFLSSLGTLKLFSIFVLFIVLLSGVVSVSCHSENCPELLNNRNSGPSTDQIIVQSDEEIFKVLFQESFSKSVSIFWQLLERFKKKNPQDPTFSDTPFPDLYKKCLQNVISVLQDARSTANPHNYRRRFNLENKENNSPLTEEEVNKIKNVVKNFVEHFYKSNRSPESLRNDEMENLLKQYDETLDKFESATQQNSAYVNLHNALFNAPKIFRNMLSEKLPYDILQQRVIKKAKNLLEGVLYNKNPNNYRKTFYLEKSKYNKPLSIEELGMILEDILKIVKYVHIDYQTDEYWNALYNLVKFWFAITSDGNTLSNQ